MNDKGKSADLVPTSLRSLSASRRSLKEGNAPLSSLGGINGTLRMLHQYLLNLVEPESLANLLDLVELFPGKELHANLLVGLTR